MTISSLSKLMIAPPAKMPFLSRANWLGRQISTLGKTLYSQLVNITNLFYYTIKTHAKESLIILGATTVSLVIYSNRKTLKFLLKPLYPRAKKIFTNKK